MTENEIIGRRMYGQQLIRSSFRRPEDLVAWFGGMQGQDYEQSKWAMGLRLPALHTGDVEDAFRNRTIVRTWAMRGTLHIVAAADVHWLLDLLAPRVIRNSAFRHRQLELDDKILKKAVAVLGRALGDNTVCTREALAEVLNRAGIHTGGQRLVHILQHAALQQVICFGPRQGKSYTFTLLDKPSGKDYSREEALALLADRYFRSHGPASLQDFVWWSGLGISDARKGIAAIQPGLQEIKRQEVSLWFMGEQAYPDTSLPDAILLPAFDEWIIGYSDRSLLLRSAEKAKVISKNGIFYPCVVSDGKVVGLWKRSFGKEQVMVEATMFGPHGVKQQQKIRRAALAFSRFTGKPLTIRFT